MIDYWKLHCFKRRTMSPDITGREHEISDSSGYAFLGIWLGEENIFPPEGRFSRNRLSAIGFPMYSRMYSDVEAQIHRLEQEAYSAVLRAFKAQSDSITWEKESLITELRNELRVTDSEHRKLLSEVNGDDIIRRIRKWQQAGAPQVTSFHDVLPSPTVSVSRKKQKTSLLGTQTIMPMPYPSPLLPGSQHKTNHSEPAETTFNPLIGRSLWTRSPAFEICPEDIRRDVEGPGINHCGIYGESSRGIYKSMSSRILVPIAERGRGTIRGEYKREFLSTQNGITKKVCGNIELLNTDTLIKEVEKVFGVSHPDPIALDKAKQILIEHEQALVDAIERLTDPSDDGEQPFMYGQATEQE